jgi:hypothetical protein
MLRKLEVEHFSVTSSKPFEKVLAAISEAVGHPDMAEFWKSTHAAESVAELERAVQPALGRTGLMQFVAFDHGAIIRKGTGRDAPRNVRLVVGNPLIMKAMAKYVPDAGSYAPVTVLVDEREDGVHLSYDRMASFLKPYGDTEALKVAKDLDAKVEGLLASAAV